MFSVILEEMKQLTIFMIVGQTILHFGVSKKFERYVKLILAFMVVSQIVFSVGSFFPSKSHVWKPLSKQEYYAKWEEYVTELEEKIEKQQTSLERKMYEESAESIEHIEENRSVIIEDICIN